MKELDSYWITSEGVEIKVVVTGGDGKPPVYKLHFLDIQEATQALIEEARHKLITDINISSNEMLDPREIKALNKKFMERADEILKELMPHIDDATKNYLIATLMHETLGLEGLEWLLCDPRIEEIVVNCSGESVRIYHNRFGWLETNLVIKNDAKIQNYSKIIARRVGRQITTQAPLLDAHLVSGNRANAVLYPISNKGSTITIRKFAEDPWTVTDFINNNTCSPKIFALIWLAIQYEMNILISGGTASGKTNFMNVCMPFIPPNHRLISIEDTRELQLPKHLFWTPLVTRLANAEGHGSISMHNLLVNSLRMRPDRIILGEIRKKEEAQVLFEGMHTGHSVYATLHANNVNETIRRLTNPPIEISENLLEAVNLNIVMFRDRRKGIRRLYQLGEFLVTTSEGEGQAKANILYRWKPSTDTFVEHQKSLKLYDEISRVTGFSIRDINIDIKKKEEILNWLVDKEVRDVDSVGKVMKEYYIDPEIVADAAKNGNDPKVILDL